MIFTTETGSVYEVSAGRVRRVNDEYAKRADGEWVRLLQEPLIEVGRPAVLFLESLSSYGEDDYGHTGGATTRITSRVEKIVP